MTRHLARCTFDDCAEQHQDPARYQCDQLGCGAIVCSFHWAEPSQMCSACVVESMRPKKKAKRVRTKTVGRGRKFRLGA